MNMNAMLEAYPDGESAVKAIEAGCDILLYYPMNENIFLPAIEAIYAAVESGRISEGRIDESYRRILAVKERFSVAAADPDPTLAKALVFDEEAIDRTFEEKLSSITCLRGSEMLCGLNEKRILCISPVCDALRGVEESRRRILSFADEFAKEFDSAVACVSRLDGMTDTVREAIDGEYDICVVGVFDAVSFPRQLEIIKALKEKGTSTIAVLLRSPYDYKFVKDCDAVITSYEYTPQAVSATVKAMKNNEYRGVLPIRLGGL
jgi:beta-N-acetylhexosaminidase